MNLSSISPVEIFAVILFFFSYYALVVSRNIIKSIIFMAIMEAAIVVFWLSIGWHPDVVPPIAASMQGVPLDNVADPLSQGLMITAIIIGLSVTAVNTVMFLTFFRKYKTADWDLAKKFVYEEDYAKQQTDH